ncbi:hypothetical protein [Kiloniella sp.]|uniref:hypothetical protein n=1 Tax=Kiloniella sp. TaxID=1938587 RepID=UPI003A934F64
MHCRILGFTQLSQPVLSKGAEPVAVSARVNFDQDFNTDTYASCRADFGSFEMTMYVSTQLAHRQEISFHGDKG